MKKFSVSGIILVFFLLGFSYFFDNHLHTISEITVALKWVINALFVSTGFLVKFSLVFTGFLVKFSLVFIGIAIPLSTVNFLLEGSTEETKLKCVTIPLFSLAAYLVVWMGINFCLYSRLVLSAFYTPVSWNGVGILLFGASIAGVLLLPFFVAFNKEPLAKAIFLKVSAFVSVEYLYFVFGVLIFFFPLSGVESRIPDDEKISPWGSVTLLFMANVIIMVAMGNMLFAAPEEDQKSTEEPDTKATGANTGTGEGKEKE